MQSRLFQKDGEFSPVYFFVNKQVVGSFKDCEKALHDKQINDCVERLLEDWKKGFYPSLETLEFVDSLVYSQLNGQLNKRTF